MTGPNAKKMGVLRLMSLARLTILSELPENSKNPTFQMLRLTTYRVESPASLLGNEVVCGMR